MMYYYKFIIAYFDIISKSLLYNFCVVIMSSLKVGSHVLRIPLLHFTNIVCASVCPCYVIITNGKSCKNNSITNVL